MRSRVVSFIFFTAAVVPVFAASQQPPIPKPADGRAEILVVGT